VAAVARQAQLQREGFGGFEPPTLDDLPGADAVTAAAGEAANAASAVGGAAAGVGSAAQGVGSAAAGAAGAAAGPAAEHSADEIYEQVVDRLRRQLLQEREQLGDLTGEYL
jgi:S-DNA-T family DNA segregation ATPase FtsK/SpoIIIE